MDARTEFEGLTGLSCLENDRLGLWFGLSLLTTICPVLLILRLGELDSALDTGFELAVLISPCLPTNAVLSLKRSKNPAEAILKTEI